MLSINMRKYFSYLMFFLAFISFDSSSIGWLCLGCALHPNISVFLKSKLPGKSTITDRKFYSAITLLGLAFIIFSSEPQSVSDEVVVIESNTEPELLVAASDEKRNADEAEKARPAEIETVLICQSPKHSADYSVIALYSKTADVIAFSSGGIFHRATKLNAPMSKSTSSIEIRISFYDKGYKINRQNLTLYMANTVRAGGEPFVMSRVSDCRVASVTDYQKARNALTRKVDADKKKREKVKQDAIKNQKI